MKSSTYVPYNPMNSLLAIHPDEMKTCIHTVPCAWMYITALLVITTNHKQAQCPSTSKWIRKCGTTIQWHKVPVSLTTITPGCFMLKKSQPWKVTYHRIPFLQHPTKGNQIRVCQGPETRKQADYRGTRRFQRRGNVDLDHGGGVATTVDLEGHSLNCAGPLTLAFFLIKTE